MSDIPKIGRCYCKVTLWLLVAFVSGFALWGRKEETPEQKQASICRNTPVPGRLQPTISSDGKMIAVLSYVDNCGTKRVRYKNVNPQGVWHDLPVEKGVDSIRFGLKRHELMLTRRVRENDGTWLSEVNKVDSLSELYKVDLDKPDAKPQTLYQAYGLTLPVEVTPGIIMVANCATTPDKRCHSALGWQWNLIKDGLVIQRWSYMSKPNTDAGENHRGNLSFGWPNVVPGQGAFWYKVDGYYKEGEPFPDYWRVAFASKQAPKFTAPLGEDTRDLVCDYRMDRCLRIYLKDFIGWLTPRPNGIANTSTKGPYVYALNYLNRGQSCKAPEVSGFIWDKSITPAGNAAVLSVSPVGGGVSHIVAIQFADGQCEPTSIEHIHFEEK